jgi:hypothetical protein
MVISERITSKFAIRGRSRLTGTSVFSISKTNLQDQNDEHLLVGSRWVWPQEIARHTCSKIGFCKVSVTEHKLPIVRPKCLPGKELLVHFSWARSRFLILFRGSEVPTK